MIKNVIQEKTPVETACNSFQTVDIDDLTSTEMIDSNSPIVVQPTDIGFPTIN